jgi:ADP-ribosylglycohydrolase
MSLPPDYAERVYSGILGKIIGVYLGRPIEGWSYERITAELGDISYYVNEGRGMPLVVTDDDISGTFTFLRALPDYGHSRQLTPQQIGRTWLNYLIEQRTILWWGGMGNSTEHTAYLRLKQGIPAPQSGSIALNGKVVAEQIGAQIFIDGWAMVAPGDPELAADLARRAGSVSHDGEAIYGAQVVAAIEAQAFVEHDLQRLIDTALRLIPADSIIARLIHDLREWREQEPDWRKTRLKIVDRYGYEIYGGNCHMVPNHALIMLGLLYGDDDFQRSLLITNTAGWDTDCNSANVGCILGIKNGLAGIDAGPDWRGPVADRMYLPTADGGRAITDAVAETYHVVNIGRALQGQAPLRPKQGARFHFELPGSVQGFTVAAADVASLRLENVAGGGRAGSRSLALRLSAPAPGVARVATATFIPPEAATMGGYELLASPTLHSGQIVRAALQADADNAAALTATLELQVYGANDALTPIAGPAATLQPGAEGNLEWRVPDTGGSPIATVGLALSAEAADGGTLYLDYLTWDGAPGVAFPRPAGGGEMWRRAWVSGADRLDSGPDTYRVIQNRGTGLLMQGSREWAGYRARATVRPHMVADCGLAAYVQGMQRYYALLLARDKAGQPVARLVKALDGLSLLAERPFAWELGSTYALELSLKGATIQASIDGAQLIAVSDDERPLEGGAIALLVSEGRAAFEDVAVEPA